MNCKGQGLDLLLLGGAALLAVVAVALLLAINPSNDYKIACDNAGMQYIKDSYDNYSNNYGNYCLDSNGFLHSIVTPSNKVVDGIVKAKVVK